ncbi:alpha/beta fold hydrolase [Candidatus Bathyarchaeota archaeon]|nr:alpha/beta fold hydrolase [Candidatus Bathyarchaeota archaeon]
MTTETEGTFEVDGVNLYTKTWTVRPIPSLHPLTANTPQPTGPTKAKLIFIHGFSDHINRYNDFFPHLAAAGIQIHGFDQRGWGRSVRDASHRGLTGPTALVLSDIAAFIASHLPSPVPVFIMGHSMGGGEALALACAPEYAELVSKIRGWVLEAPFLAFPEGEEPSSLKVFMGRLVGRLLPKQHLLNRIPVAYLSRDPAWQKSVEQDDLCHDTGTLEGLSGLLDRTASLSSGKWNLRGNVRALFLAHGDADQVTSFKASKAWFEAQDEVKDAEFKAYEGCLHQLHADLCREEFYRDVSGWILERADGAGEAGAAKTESKL